MSEQNLNAKKTYSERLPLNNGEHKEFSYEGYDGMKYALRDYLVTKMEELGHPQCFNTAELLAADWAPTQSAVIHGANFTCLKELAEMAKREYDHRHHKE